MEIRIKADGVLYEMVPPPRHLAFAITTRIKVMANLELITTVIERLPSSLLSTTIHQILWCPPSLR